MSLLPKIAATIMALSSVTGAHQHHAPIALTQVLPENNVVAHKVNTGDTLASIAKVYYGDSAYWTTLMNNNPQVSDPNDLVIGSLIQVPLHKPEHPEELARSNEDKTAKTVPQQVAAVALYMNDMPTAAPTQAVQNVPHAISDEAIDYLGHCEAGMDPAKNTGNGYYGAFQFSYGTWKRMGTGYERADLAPIEVQKAAVQRLLQSSSIYSQFPGCAAKMHSDGII